MRYHYTLLPVLASLVFANDDDPTAGTVSASDHPAPHSDTLPLDDLHDIPVPTYKIATDVMSQDIPYATAAAIASVSSQVAETPLSVYPAVTDVPLNAAANEDVDKEDDVDGDPNVISSSGSKLKRDPGDVARQPRRRGNCAPQPTIANFYDANVATAKGFRDDPTISSVAYNANRAPSGYHQTVRILKAANDAMNYLDYTVVNTGKG